MNNTSAETDDETKLREALAESQKRELEFSALLEASRTILEYRDFSQAARRIFDSCKNLTGATAGYVALLNEAGDENLVLFLDAGGRTCMVDPSLPMPVRGLRGEAYGAPKTVYENSFMSSPWIKYMPEGHVRLDNVLFAPLLIGGKAVGVMGIANKPGGFTERDAHIATAFGDIAALSLSNNWTLDKLAKSEAEVNNLNKELGRHVAEIEAANKELEAFSYSVSHDLRAPLRAIDGFSRSLLDDHADKLDDEGKRLLNVVCSSAQKMGQLIEDLLVYSRAGRQEVSTSEVDMENLARVALDDLQWATAGRDLFVEIKPLPPAHGDLSMLRQVWFNLISNAIKFTRPKSPAQIEVGGTAGETELVYYVKDNGVGFNMQYVDKLFGVFQRLHRADEFEGSGIGLASVKRIITRHGGRVWAEGKINEGATIYFALPTKEINHG
ncbi:MAG: ATP-binding protein [Gallionella sp.]|nr:ATP-binding protein [Gallionella sp.]